jgi:hypothetical protein
VINEVPVFVSLSAVIVAVPGAIAMTTPVPDTVLTSGLLELQTMTRPLSTAPLPSRVTAESVVVPPTCRLALDGDTDTVATGTGGGGGAAVTVINEVPVFVSLNAVIVAVPAAIAVTTPVPDTVLTSGLLELHAMARPLSTAPFPSRVTAESVVVPPTCRLALDGDTDTVATGTGAGALTLRLEELVLPSLVALIAVLPGAIARTAPLA